MPKPINIAVTNTKPQFAAIQSTKAVFQKQSITYSQAGITYSQAGVFWGGSDRRDGPAPENIGVTTP